MHVEGPGAILFFVSEGHMAPDQDSWFREQFLSVTFFFTFVINIDALTLGFYLIAICSKWLLPQLWILWPFVSPTGLGMGVVKQLHGAYFQLGLNHDSILHLSPRLDWR